jgi:hypothetical protein
MGKDRRRGRSAHEWQLRAAIAAAKAQAYGVATGGGETCCCLVPNVAKPFIVPFPVPAEQRPYMLDWSRSNLERLFDMGYESGRIFLESNLDRLVP